MGLTWTDRNTINLHFKEQTYDEILIVNLEKTNVDYFPEIIDTTEEIAGKDGAVFLRSKYGSRIFDLYCETPPNINYSLEDLAALKSDIAMFMVTASKQFVYLYDEKMRATIKVKLNGKIELPDQYPNWISFRFPFVAYEVYFDEASFRTFRATKPIVNRGEDEMYPIFELSGRLENPTFTINGKMFSYNGVIPDGETVIVDNENQNVYVKNSDGTTSNRNAFWCNVFTSLPLGTSNLAIPAQFQPKIAVKWRPRWIGFRR